MVVYLCGGEPNTTATLEGNGLQLKLCLWSNSCTNLLLLLPNSKPIPISKQTSKNFRMLEVAT